MKHAILVAWCFSAALPCLPLAHADEFDWLATFGVSQSPSSAFSHFPEVAVDEAGNTYVVGGFQGTVDFDPGPGLLELTSNGSYDVFVLKLTPTGQLAWAVHVGGPYFERPADIAVDGSGHVHVFGEFSGTVDFDPGPGQFPLEADGIDIFLLRLDPAGGFEWVRSLTTDAGESFPGAVFVTDDRVYTVGSVVFPADFDPGPGVLELQDAFVWTLDRDGALVWAVGGIEAIGVDGTVAGDSVYATGVFYGTRDFNPGPGVHWLESGCGDVFVLKLSTDGDFLWARAAQDQQPCDQDYTWEHRPTGIAVDGEGSVYTVGDLDLAGGGVDFDPGPGSFVLSSRGFFLWKLDQGGHLVWATLLGDGTHWSDARDVTLDPAGNVYAIGDFLNTVDFDPGPGERLLTSSGSRDAYVLRLTEDAGFSWVGQLAGPDVVWGTGLDVNVPNIHGAGFFKGVVDFDPGPGTANGTTQGDGADIFVVQLSPGGACGDGVLDTGEECDDGNTVSCDGCSVECVVEAGLDCGDGVLNEACGEECDDGNDVNGDGCSDECELPCGDGVLDPGEECDDGNDVDGDGCQSNCLLPICGDGILDAGEECDDGNDDDWDGCRSDCTIPACGDGILDPGEFCDDGNDVDGDGCQSNCRLPYCGDGIVDPAEECDDGNHIDGDGCESDCTLPEVPAASYGSFIVLTVILLAAGTVLAVLRRGLRRGRA